MLEELSSRVPSYQYELICGGPIRCRAVNCATICLNVHKYLLYFVMAMVLRYLHFGDLPNSGCFLELLVEGSGMLTSYLVL